MTRRAGPTGTPSEAPGKRRRRFEPPTRMSQATAISAPPPTVAPWQAATVGFGKRGQLVVEVGEELHPADPAVLVELLADVGAGGEAEVVGRGDDERANLVVVASACQVRQHLLEHLGVDRVARRGAVEAQDGDACR